MIADRVIRVFVAPAQLRLEARHREHLFVEDLVAQALSEPDVAAPVREPHLEVADLAVDFVGLARGERHPTAVAQRAQCRDPEGSGFPPLPGRQSGGHAPGRKSHASSPWLLAALIIKPRSYMP